MAGILPETPGFAVGTGENPYAFGVQKVQGLPLDVHHAIQGAIQKDMGIEERSGTYTVTSGYTNMLRPWSAIITCEDSATDMQKTYLLKPSHHIHELELSLRASRLGIGPKVIYANPEHSIFVEEFFPGPRGIHSVKNRANNLSEEELPIVGERLAEKTFLMYEDRPYGTPITQGGDYSQHLLVIGNGKDINVVFVDWGQFRSPNTAQSIIDDLALEFIFVASFFRNPTVMTEFTKQLLTLSTTSQYGLQEAVIQAYFTAKTYLTDRTNPLKNRYIPHFSAVEHDTTLQQLLAYQTEDRQLRRKTN